MQNVNYDFKGFKANGFLMLFVSFIVLAAMIVSCVYLADYPILIASAAILFIAWILILCGFMMLEPNEAVAMVFFGKYEGTFTKNGYYWFNPFYTRKKVSMRARNLNAEPIKVNDKTGNPIMIGLVLVWKVKDVYKALFEIDSQTMASSGTNTIGNTPAARMAAFEEFVRVQSDAALRQVAGRYAYDENGAVTDSVTLRSGADEINEFLVSTLNERLSLAGMEVVEARINYLAYAPEIAAVMLRRQQADAIISAREKIVEGAVSMVKMALNKLSDEEIVTLDDEKKAAMVSNLLVVLCADESAQPVVNTGTLYN
ncbi:MAG: SPFH domain-containing protein [Tidjanibacter sp.]|nr:SPFH domain-containing protein [Tidjanibacter sp.]